MSGLCLGLAVAAAGCGGDGGSGTTAPDPTVDRPLEQAWCDVLVRCGEFADIDSCLGAFHLADAGVAAAYQRGTVQYDQDEARTCQAALEGLTDCGALDDPGFDACDRIWHGTVAGGGTCYIDAECADGACQVDDCDPAEECCAGTCAALDPPTEVPVGGDCSFDQCVADAWCDESVEPATCRALGDVGAPCSEGQCLEGLTCAIDPGAGSCAALPAVGQPCDPDNPRCGGTDSWCDPSDDTCRERAAVGQPCDEERDSCAVYAYCDAGTCQPLPGAGEPCDAWPGCLGDLLCTDGTCQVDDVSDCP